MIGVLGPIHVTDAGGQPIELRSTGQRRLVAVLAMYAPNAVRAARLADLLDLSASGLRTAITRLRRSLGDGELVSSAGGYRLTGDVDAAQFCRVLAAPTSGDRLSVLADALGLWRGPAFDEFADESWAVGEVARLTELHAAATEDFADGLIAARRWDSAIATLGEHIASHPLRDRPRGLLIRALAGAGRQADALRAYRQYRTTLAEEVGTEPSPAVRRIEQRVATGWDGTESDHGSAALAGRQPSAPTGFPTSLQNARSGPFVGRAAIVDELHASWQSGQWNIFLASGEPGVGKTRLLAELAHGMHQSDTRVSFGRCDEDVVVSYRPWREVLEPLIESLTGADLAKLGPGYMGALRRIVPTRARQQRPSASAPADDAAVALSLLMDAVNALLEIARPVVLVLDDLHWIDDASRILLRSVAAARIDGVTVLGAFRDTAIDGSASFTKMLADLRRIEGVRRLDVDGLDDGAVAELVEHATGLTLDAPTRRLATEIRTRTAGNPLFVRELISHLVAHDALATNDGAARERTSWFELPNGVVEIVAARVAQLGGDASAVLRVAAAVGQRFAPAVVDAVVALERSGPAGPTTTIDVLTVLEQALDAALVVDSSDAMEFRHSIIRDALLGSVSAARRQRLHREIAAVLEHTLADSIDQHLEEIAYHHDRAGSERAPHWYQRAAAAAAFELDFHAVDLAERGLQLLESATAPDEQLRCDLLIERAVGLRLAGNETLDHARIAADLAIELHDSERIARALLSLSVRPSGADVGEHVAFLAGGLAHLTDPAQVSRWHVATELASRASMVPSAHTDQQRRAMLDIVGHLDPGDTLSCRIAMKCGRSLTSIGRPRDAIPIAERFMSNSGGLDSDGHPIELGLSTMWLHLGDRESADYFLDVAAGNPRRRSLAFDCQVRQRHVMRHLLDGRWGDAAAEIALIEARSDDPTIILGCAAQSTWLRRESGDASENLRAVRAMAEARPDISLIRAALAAELAEAGHLEAARTELDRLSATGFADAGSEWMTALALSHVAWAVIGVAAREHATGLRTRLDEYQGQIAVVGTGIYVIGAVDRLRAGLADLDGAPDEADRLFAAALTQEQEVRSLPLQVRTRHWWGRSLLGRGDVARARPLLDQARRDAIGLGMAGVADQIAALG